MPQREQITRRKLPHWYIPGAAHFITYRLAGTMPVGVMNELRAQALAGLKPRLMAGLAPANQRTLLHKRMFAAYDRYLDTHMSVDWLTHPAVAALIRENLYHQHGAKYYLLAYCIM